MSKKIRILHLEISLSDSELIRSLIESSSIGYDYFLAGNEKDFINILKTENIDLILSDYSQPDYNGNEALKAVRERNSILPFIFVSGTIGEDAAVNAILNGATDYVLKNKSERLVSAIKRALHEHELEIKRKQAETDLLLSKHQLEMSFDAISDIVCVISQEHEFLAINEAGARSMNIPRNQIIGRKCYELVHGTQSPIAICPCNNLKCGSEGSSEYEQGGRYYSLQAWPIKDEFGKITSFTHIIKDITGQKLAEEALLKSEEGLKSAQEIAHIGNWSIDLIKQKTTWSDEMYKIFGVSKEETQPSTELLFSLIHSDDRDRFKKFMKESEKDLLNSSTTFRIVIKKNEIRHIYTENRFELNNKGIPIRIFGIIHDITERIQYENALRVSEEKHRVLFESARDALMTLEPPTWNFTSGNDSTIKLFRVKNVIEFMSKTPGDISPEFQPDGTPSAEKAKEMIETAMQKGSHFFEWVHKRVDGEEFPATVLLTRIDHAGKKFLQATVRDITDIKTIEKQNQHNYILQTSLNTILELSIKDIPLAEIMKRVLDCIFLVPILNVESKGGIFITDNETEMLVLITQRGLSQPVLKACSHLPFGHCLCGRAASIQKIVFASCLDDRHEVHYDGISHHGHYCVPIIAFGKTLGVINLYLKEGHVRNQKEEDFLTAISDMLAGIIMRKQAETTLKEKSEQIENQNEELIKINTELEEAKEKAEESDKLKSIFLTNLSHELRTPLNGMLGFSQLITGTDDKQQITDFAKIIHKSGNQLLTIIEDLFIVSSILSEKVIKKITDIQLSNLLDKARFIINDEILKSNNDGLEFSVFEKIAEDSFVVMADIDMFGEIIRKLIRNAIKFTPGGKIEVGYRMENKEEIVFYISDTGIGIPEEKQGVIFDFFRQVEESSTREFGGIGSGLAICKNFAEKMNGSIRVESQPGKGSTFSFKLPLVVNKSEKQISSIINDADELKIDLSGKTVLVADDIDANRFFLQYLLQEMGAKVLAAEDGKIALNLVKKTKTIDLILMDLNMPEMDGYESTRLIKKIRPDIPVIVQSAYTMPEHMEKAKNSGCDAFVKKPINEKELIKVMKECLIKSGKK